MCSAHPVGVEGWDGKYPNPLGTVTNRQANQPTWLGSHFHLVSLE